MTRQPQGFAGILLADAFHLIENPSRLDNRHPEFRRAFTLAHTCFGGLLGDRLIREHANAQLAASLDEARDGDTARLDLPGSHPAGLERSQTVVSKRERGSPPGFAAHSSTLLLAKLDFRRHQHRIKTPASDSSLGDPTSFSPRSSNRWRRELGSKTAPQRPCQACASARGSRRYKSST